MKHLSIIFLLLLTGCSTLSIPSDGHLPSLPYELDVVLDADAKKKVQAPIKPIKSYAGDIRPLDQLALVSYNSDICSFFYGNGDINDMGSMVSYYSSLMPDSESSGGNVHEMIPDTYKVFVGWFSEFNKSTLVTGYDSFNKIPTTDINSSLIPLSSGIIPIVLSMRAGYDYKLVSSNAEGKNTCEVCIEEVPRDNYQQPLKSLSRKRHCHLLKEVDDNLI